MKKIPFLAVLILAFIFVGVGCQKQLEPVDLDVSTSLIEAEVDSEVIQEFESEPVPEVEKQPVEEVREDSTPTSSETLLYKGYYFDVNYPEDFIASPTEPTMEYNGLTFYQTDEAYFLSPDGTVEFFVFSPLWAGDPENYLVIKNSETLVSEKIEEMETEENFDHKVVHWVTVKANDGSYLRSWVSVKDQIGAGGDMHYVFGIKYQDSASYDRYRDQYIAFKNSLQQYAD